MCLASVWGAVLIDRQDQLQTYTHHLAASSASGLPGCRQRAAKEQLRWNKIRRQQKTARSHRFEVTSVSVRVMTH